MSTSTSTLEELIRERVTKLTGEIVGLVRSEVVSSISSALGGTPNGQANRAPTAAHIVDDRPRRSYPRKFRRVMRGGQSIEEFEATKTKIVQYLMDHPNQGAKAIAAGTGVPYETVGPATRELRATGRVRMVGMRSGATYFAR